MCLVSITSLYLRPCKYSVTWACLWCQSLHYTSDHVSTLSLGRVFGVTSPYLRPCEYSIIWTGLCWQSLHFTSVDVCLQSNNYAFDVSHTLSLTRVYEINQLPIALSMYTFYHFSVS